MQQTVKKTSQISKENDVGVSVEVNKANFEADVIQASFDRPVLVDFYAHWCGPCQMLKPMLERLVQEYDFVLAKIDIDQNPELASAYHIEGVPDVRIVSQGNVQPGFVGVLPEPQLRDLLNQLNLKSDLDLGLEAAQRATATGDIDQAKRLFAELIEKYPQNRKLALAAAKFLIKTDRLGSAEKLLASVQPNEKPYYAQAAALMELMQWRSEGQNPRIESELDQAFFQARQQALDDHYEAALQGLLALVSKNRKYRNDGARKAMLTLFDLLGDDHPLTRHYRKQLTQTLY